MQNTHAVIMAGGIGSRFWFMSTPSCSKQFIDVMGYRIIIRFNYEAI